MKRFFLLNMSLWHYRVKLYFFAALIGALTGIILLYPIFDFIFIYEIEGGIQHQIFKAFNYSYTQLKASLSGQTPIKHYYLPKLALFLV